MLALEFPLMDDFAHVHLLPDVHELFAVYNEQYFSGLLASTTLEWSNRLTLCAGLCYLKGVGGHRYCVIRLSRPLLQYRPFADTISTLLHEMIHAYLWMVGGGRLDRDGHGPDFLALAQTVNEASGARVTVYHTFHEEVWEARKHVWRCDGPCQGSPPYFGMVRRAMNRPPQPADNWWKQHQQSCGGTFHKISEPPSGKPTVRSADKMQTGRTNRDIREFCPTNQPHCASETLFMTCPVCGTFASADVDALNGHIDNCLSVPPNKTIEYIDLT